MNSNGTIHAQQSEMRQSLFQAPVKSLNQCDTYERAFTETSVGEPLY